MTVCFSRTRIPNRATLARSAVLTQHIGSCLVPGAARLGVSVQAIMCFSGRDAKLFNLRLTRDPVPIHRSFGDPGASVVQIGPKLHFWVLVWGCSVLRMMCISKAS